MTSPRKQRKWSFVPDLISSQLVDDDVIKWKHFLRYWLYVRGIHRSLVNSSRKGQWRGALIFSLICVRKNGWVNNGEAGDLRRHQVHYDVILMYSWWAGHTCDRYRLMSVLWMAMTDLWHVKDSGTHFIDGLPITIQVLCQNNFDYVPGHQARHMPMCFVQNFLTFGW